MKKLVVCAAVAAFLSAVVPGAAAHAVEHALVQRVAVKLSIPEPQAKEQITEVFQAVTEELQAGNEVPIQRFGKFSVTQRKERTGRNPRTGEALQIPAKKYPHFSSSDVLKRSLNETSASAAADASTKSKSAKKKEVRKKEKGKGEKVTKE